MVLYFNTIIMEITIYIHIYTHIDMYIYIYRYILYICMAFTILPSFSSQSRVEDFQEPEIFSYPLISQFLGISVKEALLKFLRDTFITLCIIFNSHLLVNTTFLI